MPHYGSPNPMQVPYLDLTPHDKGSWHSYPERNGWQVIETSDSLLILQDGKKRPVSEVMAFVQSWLYFSLLRELFGYTVDTDQFARMDPDGKKWVKTDTLEDLLGTWTASFSINDRAAETKIALGKLCELLMEHRGIGLELCQGSLELVNSPVMLSIAALSERLTAAVVDLYHHAGLKRPAEGTWRLGTRSVIDISQPILSLMRARGWCPYDIRRLDVETREVSILYYYSQLLPPRSSKDHSGCSETNALQ